MQPVVAWCGAARGGQEPKVSLGPLKEAIAGFKNSPLVEAGSLRVLPSSWGFTNTDRNLRVNRVARGVQQFGSSWGFKHGMGGDTILDPRGPRHRLLGGRS